MPPVLADQPAAANPRFVDRISPGIARQPWCCFTYRDVGGLYQATQTFLPANQITDHTTVMTSLTAPPTTTSTQRSAS